MWGRVAIAALFVACGRIGFDSVVTGTADGRSGDAGPVGNRVFVTSSTQPATSLGGLTGADAVCMDRAREAGLAGTFVAWLSTTAINARDRLGTARGWYRVDGRPFADAVADVAGGASILPPGLDERGLDLGDDPVFVTSGSYAGMYNSTCSDYTDPADIATAGLAGYAGDGWSNRRAVPCSETTRLTCFQTDYSLPLSFPRVSGRLAFLSAGMFDPSSGVATADMLCASEAQGAGLGGTFLALLPNGAPASARFNANGPTWVRRDGIELATTAADFLAGHPRAQLSLMLQGGYVEAYALTGGSPDAADNPSMTCNSWTSANGTVMRGESSASGTAAFSQTTGNCTPDHIYCLEN